MRQPHIRTVHPTWRVYPRVQYFRNRFLSLYPRFKTTVGSVQWKIRDHLEAINNLFEADLEVLIIANSECPIESVIVDQTSLPESADKFHDQKGSKTRVCLCFIEGNVREPQFTERLQDVIGAFNNTPASEECFLFVTFKLSENPSHEQRTNLQYELDKRLKRRPHCWNKSSSVVFEVEGTELPLSISDYFEKLLYEAFSEVAICLKLFIPSEQLVDMKTTHFDFEKFVSTDNAIDPIVSGIRAMEIKSSPSTHGSEENIGSEGLLNLARIIKCLVLFTTYEKLSISSNITQAILVESHFEEKFTKQIKPSSINLLLEIKGIKKEITTVELTEETHMSYKQKINSLLKLIMTDILSLVQNLEKEYARRASICTKMSFEVNSYLKQLSFGAKINALKEDLVISPTIRQDILRIKGVYCLGTVYNQFTVYLEPDIENELEKQVRPQINEVMKRYACNFPWFVNKVTKLPTPYAGVQYENGDIIQSHREGIVGAFVQDNIGRKYGLTCAHLLGNPGNDQPVYIRESDGNLTHFATSVSNLIVRSYIIDFAALKIKDAFERFCEIAMRDEDMLNRPWEIWDAQGTNIVSMNVFKYGRGDAILKFGIIASADMEFPTPALPGAAQPDGCCFVLIESLPGSDEPFAVEGDSGSVVCHTRLLDNIVLMNNPNEPRVTAISMVRLGGLEIEGVELGHFFSFALRHALQSVAHQANLQLSPQ